MHSWTGSMFYILHVINERVFGDGVGWRSLYWNQEKVDFSFSINSFKRFCSSLGTDALKERLKSLPR